MFQDIEINQSHYFQEQIKRGFVSRQGVVVTVDHKSRIAVSRQGWAKSVEYLDEYLWERHCFRFRKCWDIQEGGDDDRILLVLGLDQSVCVVEMEMVKNEGGITRIGTVQLLRVVEEQEVNKNRYSLNLLGMRNNLLVLTLHIHKTSIKIITLQLDHQAMTITKTTKTTLNCDQEQPYFPWLQKILIFGFQARRFDHFLIIFDQLVFENSSAHFIIIDLDNCKDQQYHIQAPCQLPLSQQNKILKDIYLVQSSKTIEESVMLLFYQHQQCLEIIQVNMSNPNVPLKHARHPFVVFYKIISCSMSPQAVGLRGVEYCLEMLNFIIHGKTELNGLDKLIILPAPFAYQPDKIINQASLPAQLLQTTITHAICSHHISTITLTPKSTIYRNFLFEWTKSQPLHRMIQQLLN